MVANMIKTDFLLVKNHIENKVDEVFYSHMIVKKIFNLYSTIPMNNFTNIVIRKSLFLKYTKIEDIVNENYENIFFKMFKDKKIIYQILNYKNNFNKNFIKDIKSNFYGIYSKFNFIKKYYNYNRLENKKKI